MNKIPTPLDPICDTVLIGKVSNTYLRINHKQELPLNVDPADVESTEAKWGLDQYSAKEDKQGYSGKRQLRSFLSFLDFVDTLLEESHKIIGATMAQALRVHVFETRLSHGSILQGRDTITYSQ